MTDNDRNKTMVVLTGAGISAESGLATFRDQGGLWCNYKIEEVATPQGFAQDPNKVYDFYNQRRAQLKDPEILPNLAHQTLVELEEQWAGDFALVTQNVDDLHQRAGNKNILAMHGQLNQARCIPSGQIFSWTENLDQESMCPNCKVPGHLRPHIVWFGEMPLFMDEIYQLLENSAAFVSIGTSGQVHPAASFVQIAKALGSPCIEINLEKTEISHLFDHHYHGPATQMVPEFARSLKSQWES